MQCGTTRHACARAQHSVKPANGGNPGAPWRSLARRGSTCESLWRRAECRAGPLCLPSLLDKGLRHFDCSSNRGMHSPDSPVLWQRQD
jgi:hypothetical protein